MKIVSSICLILIAAFAALALAPIQQVAVPDVQPSGESSNEILLSKEDDSILNTSFIASGILRGTDKVSQGSSLYRVVSLASFVTVGEVWQPSMSHSCDTVDALANQPVTIRTGYSGKGFEVTVVPKIGITWMKVSDVNDLEFIVKQSGR